MENRIMIRAGMKRHRGSLFGIAVLMFLVSLSLAAVLTVYFGGKSHIRREMQRAGFGDLTAWVSGVPDMEALTESLQKQEQIEKTEVQKLIFSDYQANGMEADREGQLMPWTSQDKRYRFFQEHMSGYRAPPQKIHSGQVYVPASMVSVMDLKIGDSITFKLARGGETIDLSVAGYYEDPFMGSSMISMKGFLVSEGDYNEILHRIQKAGSDKLARNGAMLHLFIKDGSSQTISGIQKTLNENTPLSGYTEFMYSANTIEGFMVILQNAFCGLLAAFALILLATAVIILGHSISGIVEQDNKNLGILKAMGFTGSKLIRLQIVQYTAAMAAGIILGMLAAFGLTGLVNQVTVTTTGVLLPEELPILPCVAVFSVILLFMAGTAVLKMKKILRIKPMDAVRDEAKECRWKPEKMFRLRAKGLSLQLAVRQLWSGKRRYMSACLAAVLLVFFASLAGRMNAWLGPDGKGMMDAFHPADLDIGVQTLGKLDPAKIETTLRSHTEITDSYLLAMPGVSADGTNVTANVITEPKRFHISSGETCREKDEIVLTETAASDLGVSAGDRVTVRGNMDSREFKVSGIYHCANGMGANIGMNREGYLTIGKDDPQLWCRHYFLSDASQKKDITKTLENAYGGDVHVHENSWPGLSGMIRAMHMLLIFMYGMIALFIFIVTAMAGSRILAAEQRDLGICKALGYSTGMLRMTFSMRFGITAVIGAVIGTLLASVFTDPVVSRIMRLAGISNFSSDQTAGMMVVPGAAVTLLFVGFSYLEARKIKKTDLTVLTAE